MCVKVQDSTTVTPVTVRLTTGGVTAVLTTASSAKIAARLGIGRALVGLCAAGGLAFVLIPLAAGSFAIAFLVITYLLFGFCALATNIIGISVLQAITPDRLLGRMNASRRFVVWGVIPLGGLTGGALGSHVGLRETMWFGAVGASLAFLPLLFSPVRQVVDPSS